MDGFFRILEKRLSELICTRLECSLNFLHQIWIKEFCFNDFSPNVLGFFGYISGILKKNCVRWNSVLKENCVKGEVPV